MNKSMNSLYQVYRDSNNQIHCERRPIIYDNKDYYYIKESNSNPLLVTIRKSIVKESIDHGRVYELLGYYSNRPNRDELVMMNNILERHDIQIQINVLSTRKCQLERELAKTMDQLNQYKDRLKDIPMS